MFQNPSPSPVRAAARHRPVPRRTALGQALLLALCAASTPLLAVDFNAGTEAELRQAIEAANTSPGADTIHVTADITLTQELPLVSEALALRGEGGKRALRRDDSGAQACTWDAQNAFRLLDAVADLELADLELGGGCNVLDGGGAVRVTGADLHLVRAKISGNHTFVPNEDYLYGGGGNGGGVFVGYGSAVVEDSVIADNSSNGVLASGGGIAVYGGSLEVRDSTISGNQADGVGSMGGGIYAVGDYLGGTPGSLSIIASAITGNTSSGYSPKGGGVYALLEATHVADSQISGNTLLGDDYEYARGGGIVITNPFGDAESLIERSVISNNSVTGLWAFAGGLHLIGGKLTVDATAIVNNTVVGTSKARAGGIFGETAELAVINSTIAGNTISGVVNEGGGAMQLITHDDLPMSLLLANSTVVGNASPKSHSGGILLMRDTNEPVDPVVQIESSIIAGNLGLDGMSEIGVPELPGSAPAVTANNSLIQGAVDVGGGSYAPDAATTALAGRDPRLAPLAMNGGPTPCHMPFADSPVIDGGTNLLGLAWDQRGEGHPRVVGAAADIGAVEYPGDVIFGNGFE